MGKMRNLTEGDLAMLARLRHIAPWFLGLLVMPVMIGFFRLMWADSLSSMMIVVVLLVAFTAGLVAIAWKQNRRRRSALAKWFPIAYAAVPMAYFTLAVAIGFGDYSLLEIRHSPMFILWLVGTIGGSLYWNFYYRFQYRDEEEVLPAEVTPQIDVKAIEAHRPELLAVAEKIFPADVVEQAPELAHPDVVKAIEAVRKNKAEMEAKAEQEAAAANARRVIAGWKRLTAAAVYDPETKRKMAPAGELHDKDLHRITFVRVGSSTYATEVRMKLAGLTPDDVDNPFVRGLLATEYEVGAADIRMKTNRRNNSDVTMKVVWYDPLDKPVWWAGPRNIGKSFGEVPVVFGVREDNTPAQILLPHNDKHGKVGSHVLVEGKNGSGKSSSMLIVVGEGSTRPDVCFWGIDLAKGVQTFKHVAPAMDWLIVDLPSARALIKALVQVVIPARGTLLAKLGYDNWTSEVARKHNIPFLVLLLEEGGVLFEALGKSFPQILMLARSVGICIWGSIQRAHHEVMDTNARAQFSEFLTFGVTDNDDVFGMPDHIKEKIDPAQWQNRHPGMHYHLNPLLDEDDAATPQRSFRPAEKLLRQVTGEYGPKMMRPEQTLIDALNAWGDEDHRGMYDQRETGLALEARLFGQGAVALDDTEAMADYTVEQVRPERVTLTSPATALEAEPFTPQDDPAELAEIEDAKEDPEVAEMAAEMAAEMEVELSAYLKTLGIAEEEDEGGRHPGEDKVIFMYGANGEPEAMIVDGETLPLESDEDDDVADYDDPDNPVPTYRDEDADVIGQATDDRAATSIPQAPEEVLQFEDPDEDWEPSDTREGARNNLLRVLRNKGAGWVFLPSDLYEYADLPYVDRSKAWIRGECRALAEAGVYVEQINDPGMPDLDGKYMVTARIALLGRTKEPVS